MALRIHLLGSLCLFGAVASAACNVATPPAAPAAVSRSDLSPSGAGSAPPPEPPVGRAAALPTAADEPPTATAAQPVAETTFLTVGDILLSRQVAKCIADQDDPHAPFRRIADLLAAVDFSFGNLESPFSTSDRFSISSANVFNTPRAHVRGLVDHRFRVVNLANNHVLDQGVAGLRTSLNHLADHGIATVGAGLTQRAAWQPAVVESRGVRIGFVGASYAAVNDDGTTRSPYVARIDQRSALARALDWLRDRADLRVVTMHAGSEYNPEIHPSQVDFAHRAIQLGADVVFGAHPHVLQRVERYRDRYIFHSLGNFIFDHVRPGTRQGLAVQTRAAVHIDGAGNRQGSITDLQLHPVIIDDRCAPRPATASEAAEVLAAVGVADRTLPL